ncbi:MAG: ribosome maturation factor RimP [Geodermatophilaceae bacterium]|nr:ribosome maturation factor RimP [Geodermatophilaceae bacterium]
MSARAVPRERLSAVVTSVVEASGFELEDVVITPAGRRSLVRVVVDGDDGITLDDVAELSRALSAALDEDDTAPIGASPYVLEVSSPGVDRPLTHPRHWRRAAGRLVTVRLAAAEPAGGAAVHGRVLTSDDNAVVLDIAGARRELPYGAIASARVEVEFNRPKAPDPGPEEES